MAIAAARDDVDLTRTIRQALAKSKTMSPNAR
jgi:hypothetical protein